MDLDRARTFLETNHRAVLTTRRGDGRPQLSPVAVALDAGGRAVVSTRRTAARAANARRDPRVSLCVLADTFFGPWIQIYGTAEVVELPDAMEPLVDYYRRISGEHPDWDEYRTAMDREQRVVLRIRIDHAGPDRSG
jgi:PPOX class probable F420-dependent enzyme